MASFDVLKDAAREAVKAALVSSGATALVVDPSLLASLAVVADMPFLTKLGIKQVFYANDVVESDSVSLVYMLGNTSLSLLDAMIQQHQRDQSKSIKRSIICLCVPRADSWHSRQLERAGLYDIIPIKDLPIGLVPLDRDLASMNLNVEDYLVHQDPSCLYEAAAAVASFVKLGGFELVQVNSLGQQAVPACNYLQALTADYDAKEGSQQLHVMFFDRRVDKVTPLLTQLVYSGILDEICPIKAGVVAVSSQLENVEALVSPRSALSSAPSAPATPASVAPASSASSKPAAKLENHRLSVEGDPVFAKLSDLSFVKVLSQMKVQVRDLQEKLKKNDDLSTSEMRDYVKRLPSTLQEKRFVELHVKLAQLVAHATEEDPDFSLILRLESDILEQGKNTLMRDHLHGLIVQQRPVLKVLRLLCLYSVVNNGFKREHLEPLKKDLLQCYGYELLSTLVRLELMGLLATREEGPPSLPWKECVRTLGLLPAKASLKQEEKKANKQRKDGEDDLYSYSSYVPLSAKLITRVLASSPPRLEKCLEGFKLHTLRPVSGLQASSVWLVFFVGGLCYSELAALRLLWGNNPQGNPQGHPQGHPQGNPQGLLLATTNLTTGHRMLEPKPP